MGRTSQHIYQALKSIFAGLLVTLVIQVIDLIVGLVVQSVLPPMCLTVCALSFLTFTMIEMGGPVIAPIPSGILTVKVSKHEKIRQNVHYRLKMAFCISALTMISLLVAFYASYVKESLPGAMIAVIVSLVSQIMAMGHIAAYVISPVSTGILKP